MATLALLLSASAIASVAALRDVPLGMCLDCEVTCFEDCVLKFDREIMQPDMRFVQLQSKAPAPSPSGLHYLDIAKQILNKNVHHLKGESAGNGKKCSKKQGCGMAVKCAKSVDDELDGLYTGYMKATKTKTLDADLDKEAYERQNEDEVASGHQVAQTKERWTDVSSTEVTIMDLPTFHAPGHGSPKVSESAVANLDRVRALSPHLGALQKSQRNQTALASMKTVALRGNLAPAPGLDDPNSPREYYPLHPVKLNIFAHGQITLAKCMQYCLATTCGCEGVPGLESQSNMAKMEEEGRKAGTHWSTPPVWKYRKATKAECAHGLGDNKIIKDLYVDFAPGVEGWYEVCTKPFFDKFFGASAMLGLADASENLEKCDCGVNRLDCHEPEYGCSWNKISQRCEFKAMHNTVCYKRYTFDK